MLDLDKKHVEYLMGFFAPPPPYSLASGSQEARVAKGGTAGAGAGAGAGAHKPSNRLPAGTLTDAVSFVISTDL